MLQKLIALEGMGVDVGGVVVIDRSIIRNQRELWILLQILIIWFHHMHVIDGVIPHLIHAPQRPLVEIITVIGSPHVVVYGLLIIFLDDNGQLAPDGVVHELVVAVTAHIHLEVGTAVEHMRTHQTEVLRSQGTGGVGAIRTFHEHVQTFQVATAGKGTVGHHHLERSLGITEGSPSLDVLEGNLPQGLVTHHAPPVDRHRAVVVGRTDIVIDAHFSVVVPQVLVVYLADIQVVDIVYLAVLCPAAPPVHQRVVVGKHLTDKVGTRVAVSCFQLYRVIRSREGLIGRIEVQGLEHVTDGKVSGATYGTRHNPFGYRSLCDAHGGSLQASHDAIESSV